MQTRSDSIGSVTMPPRRPRTWRILPTCPTATRSLCSMINGRWCSPARKAYPRTWPWRLPWAPISTAAHGSRSPGHWRASNTMCVGVAGHDAFVARARSILRAVPRSGWAGSHRSRANCLRSAATASRALIADLAAWGDTEIIEQARARFTAFLGDHSAIHPDDQSMILGIVAQDADAAVFEQLHAIARAAGDETEQQRYYSALMQVRDPQLAQQAAQIAMSAEIPPQGAYWRLRLLVALAHEHPQLAWSTFIDNYVALLSAESEICSADCVSIRARRISGTARRPAGSNSGSALTSPRR